VNLRLWLAYLVLDLALAVTPGPAVLTVIGQGVRHGWRRAAAGAAGISAANLAYFTLSALGVGAFVAASPRLLLTLRWGGIGYLAWTAVGLLRAGLANASAGRAPREVEGRPRALFAQAVATQLGNPKAIIFFTSVLTPFIDLEAAWSVPVQLAVFAATTTLTEFPILVGYAWAASHGSRLLPQGRLGQWQDRVAGGCLLLVAGWLALRG
jgi:threonine/homoserine/homoserine lactone efflux protein